MKSRDTVPTRETMSKICHFYPPVLVGLGDCKKKKSSRHLVLLVLCCIPSQVLISRALHKKEKLIFILFLLVFSEAVPLCISSKNRVFQYFTTKVYIHTSKSLFKVIVSHEKCSN